MCCDDWQPVEPIKLAETGKRCQNFKLIWGNVWPHESGVQFISCLTTPQFFSSFILCFWFLSYSYPQNKKNTYMQIEIKSHWQLLATSTLKSLLVLPIITMLLERFAYSSVLHFDTFYANVMPDGIWAVWKLVSYMAAIWTDIGMKCCAFISSLSE